MPLDSSLNTSYTDEIFSRESSLIGTTHLTPSMSKLTELGLISTIVPFTYSPLVYSSSVLCLLEVCAIKSAAESVSFTTRIIPAPLGTILVSKRCSARRIISVSLRSKQ